MEETARVEAAMDGDESAAAEVAFVEEAGTILPAILQNCGDKNSTKLQERSNALLQVAAKKMNAHAVLAYVDALIQAPNIIEQLYHFWLSLFATISSRP